MSKKKYIAFIIEMVLFIIASLAFYQGFHYWMADIDGFKRIFKVCPMYLTYFLVTYVLFAYYFLTHQPNEEKRAKTLKVNGFGLTISGGLVLVLVIVNMILGNYEFGNVSLIFPVDLIIIDVLVAAVGVFTIIKKSWILEKMPVICKEYSKPKWLTVLSRILAFLYVWIAEYFLGALLMCPTYIDFSAPAFGWTIPLYLLMILMSVVLFWHEYYLVRESAGQPIPKKNENITKIVLLSFATVVGLFVVVSDLFLGEATYYVSHNLQCILPIDYMISLNLGPRLLALCPLIALWFNFIMSMTLMKKKAAEPLS